MGKNFIGGNVEKETLFKLKELGYKKNLSRQKMIEECIVNEYERFLGKDKNDFLLENEILDLYEKYRKIKEGV